MIRTQDGLEEVCPDERRDPFVNGSPSAGEWQPMGESSLGNITWPDSDPSAVDQPTRRLSLQDEALGRQAVDDSWRSFDPGQFQRTCRAKSPFEAVVALLASNRLNFNSPSRVRADPELCHCVAAAIRRGVAVPILYPLFAKIMSWPKQTVNNGTTAAEEVCFHQFGAIDRAVRVFYPPGVRLTVLCDASLYSQGYLDNSLPVVTRYRNSLRDMAARLAPNVEVLDYAEELARFSTRFERDYCEARRLAENDPSALAPGVSLAGLFQSLRASLNNRGLGMTYRDYRETFGPSRNVLNKFHRLFDQKAAEALPRKLALRHATHQLESDLRAERFPDAVRATCHIHRGERPVLGLRPYPDFQRNSKLLPYHGVPLVWRDGARLRLAVCAEVQLRGRRDLVRVVDEEGETYLYDATGGSTG